MRRLPGSRGGARLGLKARGLSLALPILLLAFAAPRPPLAATAPPVSRDVAIPPPRTGDPIRDLDAALEGGFRPRADSLQAERFHLLPTDFRALLRRLLVDAGPSDSETAHLRQILELRARAYAAAFSQGTLRQSLELVDRLRGRERSEWVRLENLRDRGDTLFMQQSWAEADSVSREAARGLERLGDAYGAGRAWTRSGACAEMLGELSRAVSEGQRALLLLEKAEAPFEIVRVLHNLATALETLGRYGEAESGLVRALGESRKVPSPEGEFLESSARSLLAAIQIRRGRYPDALEHYRRSREISARLATPAAVADDLRSIGHLHSLLGRLELALAEFDTALVMAERSEDSQLAGLCLRDRGDVLTELGRLDAAAASYRMALARHAEVRDERSAGETLLRAGRLESIRGNLRAGRAGIDSALAIATRLGDAANIGACLSALGDVSLAFARHVEAHGFFTRALEQARRIGQKEQELDALRSLGRLEEILGRPDNARRRYDDALALAKRSGRHGRVLAVGLALAELDLAAGRPAAAGIRARDIGREARDSGAVGLELTAGELEVRAEMALGRIAPARRRLLALRTNARLVDQPLLHFDMSRTAARLARRSGDRATAVTEYEAAASTLEELAAAASAAELRAGIQAGRYDIYRELVGLLIELGRTAEAFEWADRSRARSLVEKLAAAQSGRAPGGLEGPGSGAERRRLQVLARHLREEESQNARPAALRALRMELATAQRDYEARIAWRRSTAAGSGFVDGPVLPGLRTGLKPDEALVEYVEADSMLAAFIVRRDGVSVVPLPDGRGGLEARVRTFRDALEQDYLHPGSAIDWQTPARTLYDDLWRPLTPHLAGIDLVWIAPEGVLRLLPFGALVAEAGAPGRRPRLLAESMTLAIAPSAATLALAPRVDGDAPRTLLAVAAGSGPGRDRLKSVEREVRDVSRRFPGTTRQILSGRRATEPLVLAAMPDADWIHFACHAHLNAESPRFSWLELTPSDGTDGLLEVLDVEELTLKARVVTLSACETGIESGAGSPFPPGEDLIGMVRAFMAAGAQSVVASLWPVPDAEVGELISGFYTELARTPAEPARALGAAQRNWLARGDGRGRVGHPYLGTAFILVGRAR